MSTNTETRRIKAGDSVKHGPSGESWLVAAVRGEDLFPAGWPCTRASVADCELIESCTEEKSLEMTERCAAMTGDGSDPRRSIARTEIFERGLRSIGIDPAKQLGAKPRIVCLCGSTRFMDAFFEAGWNLTLDGCIVLSVGVCKHAKDHGAEALGGDVAERLDYLHFAKIDMADEVLVLNVGGYIGSSTRREIGYARLIGKPVRFLEPETRTPALPTQHAAPGTDPRAAGVDATGASVDTWG